MRLHGDIQRFGELKCVMRSNETLFNHKDNNDYKINLEVGVNKAFPTNHFVIQLELSFTEFKIIRIEQHDKDRTVLGNVKGVNF